VLPEEQTRPDVARRRARWKAYQGRIAPQRLVFIDETWVKTNMAPLRGWGPRGRRLKAYAPYGHWKTLTFIAALRHDRIDAPWVIDGPINGELFGLYIEKVLAPTLAPGDVVVLDNLGSHKGKAARAAVRARGAHLIFLPPYSPDLNPIEQVFAKLLGERQGELAAPELPARPAWIDAQIGGEAFSIGGNRRPEAEHPDDVGAPRRGRQGAAEICEMFGRRLEGVGLLPQERFGSPAG
jgi:transposase